MRRSYLPAFAAASLSAVLLAGCSGGDQWIGVVLGDPTGVSYRQGISRDESVAAALDVNNLLGTVQVLHGHVDWIRYEPVMRGRDVHGYWGLGLDVTAWSSTVGFDGANFALRVPFGVDLDISPSGGFVIFVQLVPKISISQNPDLNVGLALGILFAF